MLNCFEQEDKLLKSNDLLPDSPLSLGFIPISTTYSKTTNNSSTSYISKNNSKNICMDSISSKQVNFNNNQSKQILSSPKMYQQNNFTSFINNETTIEGTNCRQLISSLDSPLSSQSTSSCELGIENNSLSPCSQVCNNTKYNTIADCETNCVLAIDQQVINYPNNSISSYSINKINIEDISIDDFSLNKVTETENINFDNQILKKTSNDINFKKCDSIEALNNFDLNKNNLLNNKDLYNNFTNLDYSDTNFFCSVWNSSESLDNLNYNQNLESDYFDNFNSNCTNLEKNLCQNNSQTKTGLYSVNNEINVSKKNFNHKVENNFKDDKKLLVCSSNQEFYELSSFNNNTSHNTVFLNESNLNVYSAKANNLEENKKSWLFNSIFEWSYEELSRFFHSLSQEKNIPIEELRPFFLDYNSIQLANMSKEQMFLLSSKYGSLIYQVISQIKTNINNSYVENYFNQQSTNFNTESLNSQNSTQKQNHQELLTSLVINNENFNLLTNDSNSNNLQNNHYINLPSFDLLKNPCYDLNCTDQSPSSSSDSDRDSISSSMTSVNENWKVVCQTENLIRQPVLSNANDLFCLPNTGLNRNISNFDNLNPNLNLTQNHNSQVQNNSNFDIVDQEQVFHNFDLQNNLIPMNDNISFQPNFINQNSNLTHENCNKKIDQNNNSFIQNNNSHLTNDFENTLFRNIDNKQSSMSENYLIDPDTHQNLNSRNENLINSSDSNQLEDIFIKNNSQIQQNDSKTDIYLSTRNLLNNPEKSKTLNTTLESLVKNCNLDDSHFLEEHSHSSFPHRHFHSSNALNNSNTTKNNNILDQSLNNSSVNKINISGRRGRPPKKDSKPRGRQNRGKGNGKLWEFIRDLLLNPATNPSFIRWERREDGVFKFVQSDKVAKLWGQRKQNPRMTYEKLSRAMRYYYKSQVLMPVFGRRLVYKFGPNATGWRPNQSMF